MQYAPVQGFNPYQGFNQSFQPQMQPAFNLQSNQPTISGRYVTSPEDITPQEVSMGSTPSLFPLVDGSAIIAKQWANDGTIKTIRYSAEIDREEPQLTLVDIMNQLDNLQDAVNALKPKRTTTRKASDAED